MSHFAELDENSAVLRVIVADQDFIDTQPGTWIQTSYNTSGGVHAAGGAPLRKNYAGPGFFYDEARDAFIPPKPFPSWSLNETTCLWEAPIPCPDGLGYYWDESELRWVAY